MPTPTPSSSLWLIAAGTAAFVAALAQLAVRTRRAWRRLPERRNWAGRRSLDRRVASEFAEMPGMTLTLSQASRLLGLPPGMCKRVLDTLAAAGILRCTPDGRYARAETLTRHEIPATERYSL